MKERPILFSGPMVRALLAGTKTQTRRLVKPQPVAVNPRECRLPALHRDGDCVWPDKDGGTTISCKPHGPDGWAAENSPYGQPGDKLWVRETFGHFERNENLKPGCEVFYRADGNCLELEPWRPSIHMPRWVSRITLEIAGVRVERLQDISDPDALAEGCSHDDMRHGDRLASVYARLWEQINGPGAWAQNPWVWVVEFKRVQQASSGRTSQLEDAPCNE